MLFSVLAENVDQPDHVAGWVRIQEGGGRAPVVSAAAVALDLVGSDANSALRALVATRVRRPVLLATEAAGFVSKVVPMTIAANPA